MKPKGNPVINRPATTPISPSGIVRRMMAARRIELNWPTRSSVMISAPIGSFSMMDQLDATDSSTSPPIS